MAQLPFDIPTSLASYAEHFEEEPTKAISRLEKQLKKRGADAVGHFLLAWLYHLQGNNDRALHCALKAKAFAPGSPFLGKLHYYLAHPDTFEAWIPESPTTVENASSPRGTKHGPVLDLDILIEKLADADAQRFRNTAESVKEVPKEDTTGSDDVDDIVSETLAKIHEGQGKFAAAIHTYERLKKLNKEKSTYYQDHIQRLEQKKEDQPEHPEDTDSGDN